MSRKVIIMFERFTQKFSRSCVPLLVVLALPLAGCVADQWAEDEAPVAPYGGSKSHPIKVAGNRATVAGCGDWTEDVTETYDNSMMANHGCAVQSNIAAMAANPNDLVRRRRMSRSPAAPRVGSLKALTGAGAAASTAASPLAKP
jgi:pilus assembly protein CpaD